MWVPTLSLLIFFCSNRNDEALRYLHQLALFPRTWADLEPSRATVAALDGTVYTHVGLAATTYAIILRTWLAGRLVPTDQALVHLFMISL